MLPLAPCIPRDRSSERDAEEEEEEGGRWERAARDRLEGLCIDTRLYLSRPGLDRSRSGLPLSRLELSLSQAGMRLSCLELSLSRAGLRLSRSGGSETPPRETEFRYMVGSDREGSVREGERQRRWRRGWRLQRRHWKRRRYR